MKKKIGYLLNRKGATYSEMLLSFFIWLIILATVIPSFMNITLSRKDILIDHTANDILRSQYIKWLNDETFDTSITKEGIALFKIELNTHSNQKELCVNYESIKQKKKQKCRILSAK